MMKKNKKIKFDKAIELKALGLVNFILASFMFLDRIFFVNYISQFKDVELESGFIISALYNLNTLTFNSILMVLIAIFIILGIFKKKKDAILISTILTFILSISIVICSVYQFIQNPIESLGSFIFSLIAVFLWNVVSLDVYVRQKNLLDKIM